MTTNENENHQHETAVCWLKKDIYLPGDMQNEKSAMIHFSLFFAMSVAALSFSQNIFADDANLRFAVVPKGTENEFFLDVKKGCERAAEELANVDCLYGGSEESSPRAQNIYIEHLIEQGIDGIAVSVIHSEFLATRALRKAREAHIPVITFDSDFNEEVRASDPGLRSAYVGTDNFQFGWELGEITRQLRPNGGKLCLISGHQSSLALLQRINGVRAALIGIKDAAHTINRLDGQNGWSEYFRCPFYSNDRPERALAILLHTLRKNEIDPDSVDTVVSVGAWPQQNEENYRRNLEPYKKALDSKKIVLVMGDAMILQRRLLSEKLAHANIGQSPFQMGYISIKLLQDLANGKRVPETVYTPLIKCFPDRAQICVE